MSLVRKAINRFFTRLESLITSNWFNPFASLYFCLRTLPLGQALRLPVWCYGRPRFLSLQGKVFINAPVKCGMVRLNYSNSGSPANMRVDSEIAVRGRLIFNGPAKIRTGNRISVDHNGILNLGARVVIADEIIIGCFKSISIGADTRITHRSQIYDSSYHYVADRKRRQCLPIKSDVLIGRGCWIANSVQVLKGSIIPDYSVVAANSLVNSDFGSYPPGTFFAGSPAKPFDTDIRIINNFERAMEIEHFYDQNPDKIYKLPDDINPSEWFEQ